MKRAAIGIAIGLGIAATSGPAYAKPLDPATADAIVAKARSDGANAFCKAPRRPLSLRTRTLCPLAADVSGCEELVDRHRPRLGARGGGGRDHPLVHRHRDRADAA
jgi:hypothetical protein